MCFLVFPLSSPAGQTRVSRSPNTARGREEPAPKTLACDLVPGSDVPIGGESQRSLGRRPEAFQGRSAARSGARSGAERGRAGCSNGLRFVSICPLHNGGLLNISIQTHIIELLARCLNRNATVSPSLKSCSPMPFELGKTAVC